MLHQNVTDNKEKDTVFLTVLGENKSGETVFINLPLCMQFKIL